MSTPKLFLKHPVGDSNESIACSEKAYGGNNKTIIASATNVGSDRLLLKIIDDQHAPMFSVRCAGSSERTAPYILMFPYSNSDYLPLMEIKQVAGMPATQPFLQFCDSNYIAPPAAGAPLSQVAGGSKGARSYYVKYSYYRTSDSKETTPGTWSADGNAYAVLANYLLVVTIPKSPDPLISHARIYVATSTSIKLQDTVSLTTDTDSTWTEPTSALLTVTAPPTANNTGTKYLAINPTSNDALIKADAIAGQTSAFAQFRDSSGTVQTEINLAHDDANIKIAGYGGQTNPFLLALDSSANPSITLAYGNIQVRMLAGQSAKLLDLQDSNGNTLFNYNPNGYVEMKNALSIPGSDPSGGGYMYSQAGAGKWRGSSGTITTFGPAEPHCPDCGRDYVLEWQNKKYGHLLICMWCFTENFKEGVIKR